MAYQKLNLSNYKQYLYKTYSSWLGKNIGIRLGAPVEGWDYTKIQETYPDNDGYLVDYDIFAADDDSNGPLFFVRPLLEKRKLTAEDVGNAFLNYIQEYKGFFWWGGVGVSSEHTAYENLKNGIKAPSSGSKDTNGLTMAEQIGGQIFSDCWGYVSGYDPYLAKDLAVKAASVTHDENGLQGAIFVAVAICLAYQRDNIHDVIEEALTFLNKDMEYYQVAKDIIRLYDEKYTFEEAFRYIRQNYGYDKYPGTCHIIPNMAVMILCMKYGNNDFDQTLISLNRCGWDTDCNCGNVGSIMGALTGVDNISKKWILPINDIVNSSSCIGALNIDTISSTAKMFTQIALRLKSISMPKQPLFNLPYGTNGFRVTEGSVSVENNALKVNSSKDLYLYTYYLPKDIYDARYDPSFSPTLYPGDQVEFVVKSRTQTTLAILISDCEGHTYYSDQYVVNKEIGLLTALPYDFNFVINKIGLHYISGDPVYYVTEYNTEHFPMLQINFKNYPIDAYGPRYEGDKLYNLRAFNTHSGCWIVTEEGLTLSSKEHALISTGSPECHYHGCSFTFEPKEGEEFYIIFNMEGFMRFSAIGFKGKKLIYWEKDYDEITVIAEKEFEWEYGKEYEIKYFYKEILVDNIKIIDTEDLKLYGLVGLYLENSSVSLVKEMKAW